MIVPSCNLIISLDINTLDDYAFNHSNTPIYFEWTKNSFDIQNNKGGRYANLSLTRGKIFYSGEWEYNANGGEN